MAGRTGVEPEELVRTAEMPSPREERGTMLETQMRLFNRTGEETDPHYSPCVARLSELAPVIS